MELIVVSKNYNDNNTLDPRGSFGIITGRDLDTPGSAWIFILETRTMVSRRQYEEFAPSDRMLTYIESLGTLGGGFDLLDGDEKVFEEEINIEENSIKGNNMDNEEQHEEDLSTNDRVEEINNSVSDERDDGGNSNEDNIDNFEVLMSIQDAEQAVEDMIIDGRTRGIYKLRPHPKRKCLRISHKEALNKYGDVAKTSIRAELQQLKDRKVFSIPTKEEVAKRIKLGERPIPSMLFSKEKYDAFGKFLKLKSRLVARGDLEKVEEDDALEAPTASIGTLFTILALAAKRKMVINSFDVEGAFLEAQAIRPHLMTLDKNISKELIAMDESIKDHLNENGSITVELRKTLYGLKESPHEWYTLAAKTLMDKGYIRSIWDKCLFIKEYEEGKFVYVVLYVDDMLVCSDNANELSKFEEVLATQFTGYTKKDEKSISFLGLEICSLESNDIIVKQSSYIATLVKDYNITETKRYPKRMDVIKEDDEPCNKEMYRSLAMKLMYLATKTRPDISYVISYLATKMEAPSLRNYDELLHVVKYLKGTPELGIRFNSEGALDPRLYIDASFNSHVDRKSHSGLVMILDNSSGCIIHKSNKQTSRADSSTEAEIIALSEGIKIGVQVMRILEEVGYRFIKPLTVYQDNEASILLNNKDPINLKGNSKFIDRKYFNTFDYVKEHIIQLKQIGTDNMIADALTKTIVGGAFVSLRNKLLGAQSQEMNQHEEGVLQYGKSNVQESTGSQLSHAVSLVLPSADKRVCV